MFPAPLGRSTVAQKGACAVTAPQVAPPLPTLRVYPVPAVSAATNVRTSKTVGELAGDIPFLPLRPGNETETVVWLRAAPKAPVLNTCDDAFAWKVLVTLTPPLVR